MKPELRDQARNKWPSILAQLGIASDALSGKHVPCPICGGRDRFRFDDRHGEGGWICNVCGAGNGVDLLMKANDWSFPETAERVRSVLGEATTSAPRKTISPERALQLRRELWRASRPIGDDLARAYLASRGITGPFSPDLRFCPSAPVSEHPSKSRLPALLALVRAPDGTAVNIHRTYLEGAAKADMPEPRCMMPGKVPEGSAIRLAEHQGKLGVAEGLETAFHAMARFGVPCWSAINTTLLEQFRPPADVTELFIFGDNDLKYGGQASAWRLAHKVACRPDPPIVHPPILPQIPGTDWADTQPDRKECA